jgi:hypothetical protein
MAYSISAGLADAEQALTYLEMAGDVRGMSGLLVNADPRYDPRDGPTTISATPREKAPWFRDIS